MRCVFAAKVVVCVSLIFAGCGAPAEPWGSVTGQVMLNDAPVGNVTVLFSNEQQGISLYGQSNAQGEFTIRSAKVPGIPVGEYRVAIIPAVTAADMAQYTVVVTQRPPQVKSPVAPRYRDLKTTDLTATVKEGTNHFQLTLKPD